MQSTIRAKRKIERLNSLLAEQIPTPDIREITPVVNKLADIFKRVAQSEDPTQVLRVFGKFLFKIRVL